MEWQLGWEYRTTGYFTQVKFVPIKGFLCGPYHILTRKIYGVTGNPQCCETEEEVQLL